MKKYLSLVLCSLFLVCLISCGDDDNKTNTGKQTVTVKITGSSNLVINTVVISTGAGEAQSFSNLAANSWSKDITYETAIAVTATGVTSNGANGDMKIQIVKDGAVLKEGTSQGNVLATSASYYNQ